MWISGPPGVGKSAILQTVCEELTGEVGSDAKDDTSDLGDDNDSDNDNDNDNDGNDDDDENDLDDDDDGEIGDW